MGVHRTGQLHAEELDPETGLSSRNYTKAFTQRALRNAVMHVIEAETQFLKVWRHTPEQCSELDSFLAGQGLGSALGESPMRSSFGLSDVDSEASAKASQRLHERSN